MDSFYPVVSFMAFLSGGCFGWYYAWRSNRLIKQIHHDGDGGDGGRLSAQVARTQ